MKKKKKSDADEQNEMLLFIISQTSISNWYSIVSFVSQFYENTLSPGGMADFLIFSFYFIVTNYVTLVKQNWSTWKHHLSNLEQ